MVGAARMVVGHTPQMSGCNCECEGKIWRIDVGMSSGVLDATPEVLEIVNDPTTGQSKCSILAVKGRRFATAVEW